MKTNSSTLVYRMCYSFLIILKLAIMNYVVSTQYFSGDLQLLNVGTNIFQFGKSIAHYCLEFRNAVIFFLNSHSFVLKHEMYGARCSLYARSILDIQQLSRCSLKARIFAGRSITRLSICIVKKSANLEIYNFL